MKQHEDDDGEAEEDELPEIECEYFEEDKEQNDKISPFSTLVKMSSGKNPSTFSLPPELACHTYFPGRGRCATHTFQVGVDVSHILSR